MIRPGRKQTNWQPHGYQGFGFFIHGLWSGSPPDTRGRSPVRKSRTPGSVRGYPVTGIPTATYCRLQETGNAGIFHAGTLGSGQDGGQTAKNVVHDSLWHPFESFAAAGFHIDRPGLIATHNAGGTYAGAVKRHSKACCAGKIASAGHGHNNRQAGHAVKSSRRDNQYRPRSLLLMTCGRVKRDKPDFPLSMSDFLLTSRRRIQPFTFFCRDFSVRIALCQQLSQ